VAWASWQSRFVRHSHLPWSLCRVVIAGSRGWIEDEEEPPRSGRGGSFPASGTGDLDVTSASARRRPIRREPPMSRPFLPRSFGTSLNRWSRDSPSQNGRRLGARVQVSAEARPRRSDSVRTTGVPVRKYQRQSRKWGRSRLRTEHVGKPTVAVVRPRTAACTLVPWMPDAGGMVVPGGPSVMGPMARRASDRRRRAHGVGSPTSSSVSDGGTGCRRAVLGRVGLRVRFARSPPTARRTERPATRAPP
jgi:hypothetical protein